MKIIYGDILTPIPAENPVGTIVCHQVNCQGVMGAGLAKQVKQQFPGVFDAYVEKCFAANNTKELLGNAQACMTDKGFIIVNIFAQNRYGRRGCFTDYNALRKAFTTVATAFPNNVIRIPYKIGCGLAGGDWNIVLDMIRDVFKDNPRVELWSIVALD